MHDIPGIAWMWFVILLVCIVVPVVLALTLGYVHDAVLFICVFAAAFSMVSLRNSVYNRE